MLTVSIDSDDREVRFNVITRGILESRQLSAAGGVRCWSGKLPVAADNAIEVHATEKTCRYTLEVQIDN